MRINDIHINNSYFCVEDTQIIMLIIWGLTEIKMAEVIGCELWEVKRSKSASFCKMGVDCANMLSAKALDFEFKRNGTFRDEKLFTTPQLEKILLIKPILKHDIKL